MTSRLPVSACAVHPEYAKVKAMCEKYPAFANEAFQVAVDLKFAKLWIDLSVHDLPQLGLVYILARETFDAELHVFLPVSIDTDVSMARLNTIFAALREKQPDLGAPLCIYLSVVATDSTTVYYRIFDVLVPPKEDKYGLKAAKATAAAASLAAPSSSSSSQPAKASS